MHYTDLRDFVTQLEARGELKRVSVEVSPKYEMTEICDRVLRASGPAVLFEKPAGHTIPVLGNLFGSVRRVGLAMGVDGTDDDAPSLRDIGRLLASMKEPQPPKGFKDLWGAAAGTRTAREEGVRHGAQGSVLGAVPGGGARRS